MVELPYKIGISETSQTSTGSSRTDSSLFTEFIDALAWV